MRTLTAEDLALLVYTDIRRCGGVDPESDPPYVTVLDPAVEQEIVHLAVLDLQSHIEAFIIRHYGSARCQGSAL